VRIYTRQEHDRDRYVRDEQGNDLQLTTESAKPVWGADGTQINSRDWPRQPGLTVIRLHDARHPCGMLMHLRGGAHTVIGNWLGHANSRRQHGHVRLQSGRCSGSSRGHIRIGYSWLTEWGVEFW